MVCGAAISTSRKQKLNTKSSTEAEVVGVDDVSTLMLWMKLFMEAQGYTIQKNILYQDNKSAMLLEKNGNRSSSQRTLAMHIRYFFISDPVEKGNLMIEYCLTNDMVADYFTKPLQGAKFQKFKAMIMGTDYHDPEWTKVPPKKKKTSSRRQECVGGNQMRSETKHQKSVWKFTTQSVNRFL